MNFIKSKSFLTLLSILFIIGFSTSARTLMNYPSSVSLIYLGAKSLTELPGETNPLFVAYPLSLKDHRQQTKEYVKAYSEKKRNYIIHIFNKGKKFFPKAIDILDKYDVPAELRMLPILESEFNVNAVSPVGAVGYWQFMAELAREYGLHIGGKYDERKNFSKSTTAAAKFFRDQLAYFNDDLLLSVAAYNCGPGRVRLSVKKSGKPNADFWDVKKYLPAETRKFVMNFIALNVIAANYEKFIDRKLNFNEAPTVQFAILDSINFKDSIPEKIVL
ncbi:MAG: lytic transglycosylase domain-containing protein [Ginsengibacter sp.]